jgi:hypothetical protein
MLKSIIKVLINSLIASNITTNITNQTNQTILTHAVFLNISPGSYHKIQIAA